MNEWMNEWMNEYMNDEFMNKWAFTVTNLAMSSPNRDASGSKFSQLVFWKAWWKEESNGWMDDLMNEKRWMNRDEWMIKLMMKDRKKDDQKIRRWMNEWINDWRLKHVSVSTFLWSFSSSS